MTLRPDALRLDDRVALVTGAAQGIGEAVALGLAALGADLALCDRDEAGLAGTADQVSGLGRRVLADVFDVRDREAVEGFVDRAAAHLGRLDVLVANVGGGFRADFVDVAAKGEDALVAENFTTATACIRAVVPHLTSGGSIVCITSIEAHRAAPGFAVYAAQKAAVENLTRTLALELGDRMIRINCVAPDVIPTPGIGEPPVTTPLPVAGHVDDVAAAVAFLAGDLARFVTGSTIHVDGGNAAAGGWHRTGDGWVP